VEDFFKDKKIFSSAFEELGLLRIKKLLLHEISCSKKKTLKERSKMLTLQNNCRQQL
jgi:hypothetical protein